MQTLEKKKKSLNNSNKAKQTQTAINRKLGLFSGTSSDSWTRRVLQLNGRKKAVSAIRVLSGSIRMSVADIFQCQTCRQRKKERERERNLHGASICHCHTEQDYNTDACSQLEGELSRQNLTVRILTSNSICCNKTPVTWLKKYYRNKIQSTPENPVCHSTAWDSWGKIKGMKVTG